MDTRKRICKSKELRNTLSFHFKQSQYKLRGNSDVGWSSWMAVCAALYLSVRCKLRRALLHQNASTRSCKPINNLTSPPNSSQLHFHHQTLLPWKVDKMSARAAALAALKAKRTSGKSRLDDFEIEEDNALYDEVDDEDYKNIVRKRLDEPDFVVDDNGAGYADDGREEWDNEPRYDDSASEEDTRTRGKTAGGISHTSLIDVTQ
jgi:hypothetical protein